MSSGRARRSRGAAGRGPVGTPRLHRRVTDSTNERAKELALRGAPHGALVTADEQTAGRGRQGRRWQAPAGQALLASLLVRPLDQHDALLPLAVAVAVCEACEASAGVGCRIKWPNDVLIEGRKVAGILVEGRPQDRWAVVGVGVNVTTAEDDFPPEIRERAVSLAVAAGRGPRPARPTVAGVLAELLESFPARIEDGAERVLEAWRARDALAGEEVSWERGRGVAAGVDERGSLIVATPEGRLVLDSGEVHLGSEAPGGRSSRAAR